MDTALEVYNLVTQVASRQYVFIAQCQHSQ